MITCDLCRNQMKYFLEKNGYRLFRCPGCGLIKTRLGRNYTKFVKEFYQEGYFTGNPACSAYHQYETDKPYIVRNLQKILDRIKPFIKRGKLLDVGCAMGYFVQRALEEGFDAYGFDPSAYALSRVPATVDGRVIQGTVETVSYPVGKFDLVTMFDIFEHVEDPLETLARASRWLNSSGYLVIATGDTDSLAARMLGERWTFYIPPQHLFFFNRSNLCQMLNRRGFDPVAWFSIGKWLSLGYVLHLAYSDSRIRIAGPLGKLSNRLGISGWPLYLPLRDNMVVIARKK